MYTFTYNIPVLWVQADEWVIHVPWKSWGLQNFDLLLKPFKPFWRVTRSLCLGCEPQILHDIALIRSMVVFDWWIFAYGRSNPNPNIMYYYPTLLRRVQITRETSTNIKWYLYSSHSPARVKDKKPSQSQNFGETKTLDNKSLIRHFSV